MKVLLLISILLLAGCATPYQQSGLLGGFNEIRLSDNSFRVTFNGNAHTPSDKASNYCLLRCAELCLENGYKHFVLISENTHIENSTYSSPTYARTTHIGNYRYTRVYGGQTYSQNVPTSTNEMLCFEEKPEGYSYDASYIKDSFMEEYQLSSMDQ